MVTVRGGGHEVGGVAAQGERADQIVLVDGHEVALVASPYMLVVRNDDRPGMIGLVGSVVGNAGVSIDNMAVGQTRGTGTALMALGLDRPLDDAALTAIRTAPGIIDVHPVNGL
jgi:L-serine deaminase